MAARRRALGRLARSVILVTACLKAFRDNERVADVGVVRAVTPCER
jgi:hypothetical protein